MGDFFNGNIREITPSGTLSTLAGPDGSYGIPVPSTNALQARFNQPNGVALDGASNLYVADTLNNCIRQVTPTGTVIILAGSVVGIPGTNNGTNTEAQFFYPSGLCLDAATNIYVADYSNSTVRMITPDASHSNWVTTTLAGRAGIAGLSNGPGTNALFNGPIAVAVDDSTNLYVTDNGNALVRMVAHGGAVTTYPGPNGGFDSPFGIAVDSSSNVYVSDDGKNAVYTITPAGAVNTNKAGLLNSPEGIALDSSTNVYIANAGANTILAINAQNSNTTTVAGMAGFVGSGDGLGPAAQFDNPAGVAVDALGNVYVADTFNNTIRTGTPFYPGQTAVLMLNTIPSGLPLQVNGANLLLTPNILTFASGGLITNTAQNTNGMLFTNSDLTTISTNNYAFTNWTTNGVAASSSRSYTFTIGTNVSLVANYVALYNLTVSATPTNGGAVSGGGTNVAAGSTVTVVATAANDYRFGYWAINNVQVSTNPDYSFALTGNNALVATFLPPLYTISLLTNPATGGIAVGAGSFESNSVVTMTATTNSGYAFTNWTTTNGSEASTNESYTFTLDTNETLTANFLPYFSLVLTDSPNTGGTSIAICGATSGSNLVVVSNSMVTVTATTNFGYAFIDWTTNGGGTNSSASFSFALDTNETLVAHYTPYYTLTVTNVPTNGGTVIGSNGATSGTSLTLLSNNIVTVTATTNFGYAFVDWVTNGGGSNASNPYIFPLNATETLAGHFSPYYTVSVNNSPTNAGTATVSSGGTTSTNLTVLSNSTVAAKATATSAFLFHHWDNPNQASLNNPYNFALNSNETLTAVYVAAYTLTVPVSPPGGGTVSGAGKYAANTSVTVTATSNPGYQFIDWTTNGGGSNLSNPYIFPLDANATLSANFQLTPAQVAVFNGTNVITNGDASPVNFGSVQLNQPLPDVTFTVTNIGGQPLVLTNILVPANGYTLVTNSQATITNFPFTIAGVTNGTHTNGAFVVQLNTTNVGLNSGNITLLNNATNSTNGSFSFAVTGTVLPPAPQIGVLYDSIVLGNGQATPVNFGTNVQNQPGNILTFTVTNTGELTLDLTSISVPPGFLLVTNPPSTIATNASGTFSVLLDNGTAVGDSGNIVIINNDPTNNPFYIPITSEVITKIIALDENLVIGVVPTNSTTNASFTISNIGSANITVSMINYPAGVFSGNWSGGVIAASNSQPVNVTFSPAAPTNYSGTVMIISDATSGMTNFFISAFGANTNFLLTILTNGVPGAGDKVTPNEAKVQKPGAKLAITAVPGKGDVFAGWVGSTNSTNNPLKFTMEQSSILQANFISNPFVSFVGTYNGLFWATNDIITEQSAGMLKGLALTSKGTYTGTLLVNGESKAFNGGFNVALNASNSLKVGTTILGVGMSLTSNGSAPQVTGTVSGAGWVSALTADRATNNKVISTEYTMLVPPDNSDVSAPSGYGYATITASLGTPKSAATVKISGALADGTTFSQSVPVSLDGYVPIYANLYSSKGMVLGWINLTNASGDALYWVHPLITSGTALFKAGFTNTNSILLSPWTSTSLPPANALPTNFVVVDTVDNNPLSTNDYPLTFTSSDALISVKSNSLTLVSGKLTLKTGLIKMTFGKTNGSGVLLLNATNGTDGGGFFLIKSNTGPLIFQGP